MTDLDLYTHYRAHCDLDTRDLYPGITLPASITPAVWMPITDVAAFVSLHLTRLTHGPPILRKLASKNLKALHRALNSANSLIL